MVSVRPVAARRRRRPGAVRAAILFDLDDTLYDHRFASSSALAVLRRAYPSLRRLSRAQVERRYRRALDRFHLPVLEGALPLTVARRRRFAALFAGAGETLGTAELDRRIRRFRTAYRAAERAVPGAVTLLRDLHRDHRIVIVSNNLHREQLRKLRKVGLRTYVDAVVTSQRAGSTKPAPEIFHAAVGAARLPAGRCLVVGNSWPDDIVGAHRAGLRAIWFAPGARGQRRAGTPILTSLRPPRAVGRWIRAQGTAGRRTLGNGREGI